jgi:propanol-preferring alcohol dehydrogenase
MPHMMQAAVVEAFGQPLTLRAFEIPSAGPGQILVKTEACGGCHTDLHAACGDWPVKPTHPSSRAMKASASSSRSVLASAS